jgi:hypothetical protein
MFYKLMSAKYANRRTFSPETGAGAGDAGDAGDAGKADTKADPEPKPADDAGQGGNEEAVKVSQPPRTDAEKAALLREVMEKKNKLRDAEDRLKTFEGVDPVKYRELVAQAAEKERLDAEAKGDFERVKTMMAEAHSTEKQALEAELKELRAQLSKKDGTIDDLTVGNAFGSSSFISEAMVLSPTKSRVLYGSHFEIEEGRVVAYDKPRGSADRTKLVNASGDALGFDAALEKIVHADPDKKSVLRSVAKPGAGSGTTPGASKEKSAASNVYGVDRIRAALTK